MRTTTRSVALLFLLHVATGCGGDQDGDVAVQIENGVWAEVIQGDSLRVEGNVDVERDGDLLRISPQHGNDGVALLRLPFTWRGDLRTRGNAEVVLRSMALRHLEIDAEGTSRIEASGATRHLVLRMRGDAGIEACPLVAGSVRIDGAGNATGEITATVRVEGTLSGNVELVVGGGADTSGLLTEGEADVILE